MTQKIVQDVDWKADADAQLNKEQEDVKETADKKDPTGQETILLAFLHAAPIFSWTIGMCFSI